MKVAVLDIGGTFIKYGYMLNEQLVTCGKLKTPDNMEDFWKTLDDIWEYVHENAEGLAISMPGVIDSVNGYAYNAGSLLYFKGCNFAQILSNRYNIPVWIGNDAKCAGIAEVGYGVLQGVKDAIVVILGTGIGGCIIKDGNVHYGSHFSAGEISFLQVNVDAYNQVDNWWCNVNGSQALLKYVQSHLHTDQIYSGEEIFEMANTGNTSVLKALKQFSMKLAVQLFNMQCILDAEVIAIGGGISAQPLLLEMIKECYEEVAKKFPYPVFVPNIEVCQYRNEANMLGAYYEWKKMYQR